MLPRYPVRTPQRLLRASARLPSPKPVFKNPRMAAVYDKWMQVKQLSSERQMRLKNMLDRLNEMERMRSFDFDVWRQQYLQWMKANKSRIMDFFYRQDKDRDGRVTRQEFIEGIIRSRFPTSRLEMEAVADRFDFDGDGYIDYREFVAALRHPIRRERGSALDEQIQDEVQRQVKKCVCPKQYHMHKITDGQYRFGESQKLRLVRILRSTVMVRVGGGWVALDEFLVKNDPCRVGCRHRRKFSFKRRFVTPKPKGRTNLELREQFVLPRGASQAMSNFRNKTPNRNADTAGAMAAGAWNRATSPTYGPIVKVREKTIHGTPWRQNASRRRPVAPDAEVKQIMSSAGTRRDSVTGRSSPGSSRASSRCSSRTSSIADSEYSEASDQLNSRSAARHPWTMEQIPRRKLPARPFKANTSKSPRAVTPVSASDAKVFWEPGTAAAGQPRFGLSIYKAKQKSAEALDTLPGHLVTFPTNGRPPGPSTSTPRPHPVAAGASERGEATFKTPRAAVPGSRIPMTSIPTALHAGDQAVKSGSSETVMKHALSTGSLECRSLRTPSKIPTLAIHRKQSDA